MNYDPFGDGLAHWKAHVAAIDRLTPRWSRALSAALTRQVEAFLEDPATHEMPDLITPVLRRLYADVGFGFARRTYERAPVKRVEGEVLTEWQRLIDDFIRDVAGQRILEINDTTRRWIREVLLEAQAEGLGTFEAARRLRERWRDISYVRAERIARTELNAAGNYGSLLGARSTARRLGVAMKKRWFTTKDGRERRPPDSRFDHHAADGQVVDLDKPFNVSGEALMHPGDPAGSAGNVINCRCALLFDITE